MTTPAGWYDDGSGQMRYWDGMGWTEHVAPRQGQEGAVAAESVPAEAAPAEVAPAEAARAETPAYASAGGFADPGVAAAPVAPMQAAYGAAPISLDSGAPQKKSRLGLWVTLGLVGLLVVVGGGIAAVVLLMRATEVGPEDQLAALVESWQNQDCPAEYELMHPYITDGLTVDEYCADADYSWFTEMTDWEYVVDGSEVQDSTAYVSTTEYYRWEGDRYVDEWVYEFHKVDGRWLYYDATYAE